ncbi:CCR4-NOT transcription complex subunit 1-like, partial [Diaphorina citri]|uniref:CCR4-NOT transcription complex subunit 1-like n=1 Tax=Diaphorina citri TaxID=121845 RepID=A0A1S3DQ39_DIACI
IRDLDDPPGLFEKTEYLLREWVTIYHSPAGVKDPNKAFTLFVHQMNCHGILKSDELITRFFRFATSLVVEISYRLIPDLGVSPTPTRSKMFQTLDAYAKLIALLVKHSGSGEHANSNTKINLLNKVLGIISGVLITDHFSFLLLTILKRIIRVGSQILHPYSARHLQEGRYLFLNAIANQL